MKKEVVLRKFQTDCPLCEKKHYVIEKLRMASLTIKNEEVEYEEKFLYCENADELENEYQTASMVNQSLLNARNAYRLKKGLLTSNEIVDIRNTYGLSQVDLAKLLGWGEATISRYESKAIQDEAYDAMLRLIKDNPLKALDFLKKNADSFSLDRFTSIKEKICSKLGSCGKEYLAREYLKAEYASFEELSDLNGYTLLNIDKIETIISYFAEELNNLFKVKLMKMLWYADVLSYNRKGVSMTGMVYRHETMGALPVGHNMLMNLENVNVKEEAGVNYEIMYHFYPLDGVDYTILSSSERKILDAVIEKFREYKSKEIVEYMHKEKAYVNTKPGAIIPFSMTKGIKI